nr:MAG TPA: hypothetical protein [Caudoviricetes sp.]
MGLFVRVLTKVLPILVSYLIKDLVLSCSYFFLKSVN